MHILKNTLLILLILAGNISCSASQSLDSFFDQTDAFLSSNVKNGKVAYQDIGQHPAVLDKMVHMIAQTSLDEASSNQKKAFYINAYNLLVIHSIINHDIPSSPQDIDGFFDTIKHKIAEKKMTLDQLETNRLRKVYHDPRLHFALVCGAVSCPPLRPFAYQPDQLDKQLTNVTRATLNSNFIRINKSQKTAEISEIFKWYQQDFEGEAGSVRNFINQYRNENLPAGYRLKYYSYNWQLNAQQ